MIKPAVFRSNSFTSTCDGKKGAKFQFCYSHRSLYLRAVVRFDRKFTKKNFNCAAVVNEFKADRLIRLKFFSRAIEWWALIEVASGKDIFWKVKGYKWKELREGWVTAGGFVRRKIKWKSLYCASSLLCDRRQWAAHLLFWKKKRRAMKGEEAPTNRTKWKGCHASAVTGCRYTLGAGQSHFALIATRL